MILNPQTFEEIVNVHYESLYRFAYSLARSEADACDLTQETFQQLGAKAYQLRDVAKVKTWLFTTLYRAFVDGRRRQIRHPHVAPDAAEHELPVVEPDVTNRIDAATAREALLRIEETYRAPLTLYHVEDYSYAEIASILGIPIGTVMSRISRGRALLRELLEDRNPKPVSSVKPINRTVP